MCGSEGTEARRRAVRVFLLSGHALVRRSLADLLEQEGFEVVGEAESIAGALTAVPEAAPAVVLVENRLPDGTSIEACRALRSAAPGTRCLTLTTYDEGKALRSAVLAGAPGYVLQKASADGLPEKLRQVAAGEQLYSSEAAHAARGALAVDAALRCTRAEGELLSLMLQGLSNAQIGEALNLPQERLAGRLSSLLAKLGYRPAPDIARYAGPGLAPRLPEGERPPEGEPRLPAGEPQ
ncbi:Response regulator containing a CheY-like receiver domain and an HTH DNA-binding domain protein [Sinomonas atrocyanea]|uniref:Response regulator containing a CheY-like receiver domain and an HTH DNA-binding domain protein n=1 Tax=Sinomonas atrocyanea TaxID=37927 RepID=A0A126ZV05_9MICC|nr:response regulator transcription factor [Sinomonas atrocyanea]AMM30797.1 Response regulator containing a CheY-like receiver domain and an HTH DNA-binding domain protein [Sinomonas atrocyanea]GEB63843.1 putative transcriptional regulator, LuxR family protein [Sinomonas atrocyanea]GGG65273.1 putative transcriptional regulator, LuxR family protein [Sinomonas atrocyanea]